jgi:hypothetical protein
MLERLPEKPQERCFGTILSQDHQRQDNLDEQTDAINDMLFSQVYVSYAHSAKTIREHQTNTFGQPDNVLVVKAF